MGDIVTQGTWVWLKIEHSLLVIGDLSLACLLVPDTLAHGHVQVYCDVSHLQLHWKSGTAACSLQDRFEREISGLRVHVGLYHSSWSSSLDPWISREYFLINKCMELNIGEMSSRERNSQYFSEKDVKYVWCLAHKEILDLFVLCWSCGSSFHCTQNESVSKTNAKVPCQLGCWRSINCQVFSVEKA